MKKTITAAIFLFALTASAAFGQTTADEWYTKAGEYFESGDHASAITAYSEAIKRDSSNINAYLFRGFAYYQIKNYDAAIADYNTVIKDAPDFPDVYVVRGDAYGAKGAYHTAAADYKTGLEKGYDPGGFNVDKSSKADMWFCGAMFMEITVNRFLGKPDVVAKYENWLKTVCDKNKLTRAEVEAFYRQNIGALVAGVVDAEFNKISFMIDRNYNAVLTRNPQNGQYVLSYEDVKYVTKTLTAPTLEVLSSAMSKSGDFSATAFDTVRAQTALIPAVVFERAGKNSLEVIKDILSIMYTSPNQETYNTARSVYLLYFNMRLTSGDSFFGLLRDTYENVLTSLSPDLARKVVSEVNRFTAQNTLSREQSAKLEVNR